MRRAEVASTKIHGSDFRRTAAPLLAPAGALRHDGRYSDGAMGFWIKDATDARRCRDRVQGAANASIKMLLGRLEGLHRCECGPALKMTPFGVGSCDRFFFVCHSAAGALRLPAQPRLHLWTADRLSDAAIDAGLYDWLIDRTR
jgi:hypothetical protein